MFKNDPIFKAIVFVLVLLITATCLYIYFIFFHKPKENLQNYFPKPTETLKYSGSFGYNYYINLATTNTNEGNTEYIFTGKALENVATEVDSNNLRLKIRYVLQGDSIIEYFDMGELSYNKFKKLTILKSNLKTGDTWQENTTLTTGETVLVTTSVLSVSDDIVVKYSASQNNEVIHEEVRTYKKGAFITDIKYTTLDEDGKEYSYRIFRTN